MKKFFYPAVALLATSMIACTSENEPTLTDNDQPVEIKLSAKMAEYAVEVQSRAALNDFDGSKYYFVRWDGETQDLSATPLAATIASGGVITFDAPQYYKVNGDKSHFIGYYPQGTNNNGIITFTGLNGTQDILYAGEVSGDKTTPIAAQAITFNHKLAQLNFKFVKDASFTDNVSITALKVNGTKLPESLNLANGELAFATTASPITVFENKTYAADATPTENVMVEPVAGTQIELEISLEGIATPITVQPTFTVENLAEGKLIAGTAYTITLTFKQTNIEGTAKMEGWKTGTGSGEIQ